MKSSKRYKNDYMVFTFKRSQIIGYCFVPKGVRSHIKHLLY